MSNRHKKAYKKSVESKISAFQKVIDHFDDKMELSPNAELGKLIDKLEDEKDILNKMIGVENDT